MITAIADERGEPLFEFGSHAYRHAPATAAG
jgi:hypothetical protein